MYDRLRIAAVWTAIALPLWSTISSADDAVYNRVKQSTVWIVRPDGGSGSGVLVDASRRLVVTNAHVVGNHRSVVVFAPVRDMQGGTWSRTSYKRGVYRLSRAGYGAEGRVIAKVQSKDLAVLRLDRKLKGMQKIEFSDWEPDVGDGLHIVGNPAHRPLFHYTYGGTSYVGHHSWRYRSGQYVSARIVQFDGRTWFGNSGGPVVNDDDELVGVISGTGQTTSTAIHVDEVQQLLNTIVWHNVFSIRNDTNAPVHYSIQTRSSDAWQQYTLQPGRYHIWWLTYDPQVEIAFDRSYAEGYQGKSYELSTYSSLLGNGIEPVPADGKQYRFSHSGSGLDLFRVN